MPKNSRLPRPLVDFKIRVAQPTTNKENTTNIPQNIKNKEVSSKPKKMQTLKA
jgi:hypothetical protein